MSRVVADSLTTAASWARWRDTASPRLIESFLPALHTQRSRAFNQRVFRSIKRETHFHFQITMLQPLPNLTENAGIQSSFYNDGGITPTNFYEVVTILACRSALVKSPAASRVALAKHHSSIGTELAKALEIVGGYSNKVSHSFFAFDPLSIFSCHDAMMCTPIG